MSNCADCLYAVSDAGKRFPYFCIDDDIVPK